MNDDQASGASKPARNIADIITQIGVAEEVFIESIDSGLIVLDANVLLALYRIGADARKQVLESFRQVSDRIWVPHQAIVEFHRNKASAVVNRISEFKRANATVKIATAEAISILEAAVNSVVHLRERTFTSRPWAPADLGLDQKGFESRLDGALDAAKAELKELESEHDLSPGEMQKSDPILLEIDILIAGKIGDAYSIDRFRSLVEEARDFRFPNKMPPGYKDAKEKSTDLRAAGDYVLWRQVIDKAAARDIQSNKVVIITNDVKQDWWTVTENRRRGARPELVQELNDYAKSQLMLLTLYDFAVAAKERLNSSVSDSTVKQIHDAMPQLEADSNSGRSDIDLNDYSRLAFEELVRELFSLMGYELYENTIHGGFDFDIVAYPPLSKDGRLIAIEADKNYRLVNIHQIRRFRTKIRSAGFHSGIYVTSSNFTSEAQEYVKDTSIILVDGDELRQLIAGYM